MIVLVSEATKRLSSSWIGLTYQSYTSDPLVVVSAIEALLTRVSNSLENFSTLSSVKFELQLVTTNFAGLVSNTAKYLSLLNDTTNAQLELVKLQNTFLRKLAGLRTEFDLSMSCGEKECLEVVSVNQTSVEVDGASSIGGANVENGTKADAVALSRYYFNPFPITLNESQHSDEQEDSSLPVDINTPVVGISLISQQANDEILPKTAPTFEVDLPLIDLQNGASNLSLSSLHLLPPCTEPFQVTARQFVSAKLVNQKCGIVTMEIDITNLLHAYEKHLSDETESEDAPIVGYMIIEPQLKCYNRSTDTDNSKCLAVYFTAQSGQSICPPTITNCTNGFVIANDIRLPAYDSTLDKHQQHPFSIPLRSDFIGEIATKNKTAIVLLQNLQPDPLQNKRIGANKFFEASYIL